MTPYANIPTLFFLGLLTAPAHAFQPEEIAPPLKGIPVPVTPGLLDGPSPIVIDRTAAIQLGKALFWDMNVGSDGVACASWFALMSVAST